MTWGCRRLGCASSSRPAPPPPPPPGTHTHTHTTPRQAASCVSRAPRRGPSVRPPSPTTIAPTPTHPFSLRAGPERHEGPGAGEAPAAESTSPVNSGGRGKVRAARRWPSCSSLTQALPVTLGRAITARFGRSRWPRSPRTAPRRRTAPLPDLLTRIGAIVGDNRAATLASLVELRELLRRGKPALESPQHWRRARSS